MSIVTAKMNQEQVSGLRRKEARDVVTLFSALAGAILFLAVPEFGIPVAIAAAGLGAISGVSALTKPKTHRNSSANVTAERRNGRERRVAASSSQPALGDAEVITLLKSILEAVRQ